MLGQKPDVIDVRLLWFMMAGVLCTRTLTIGCS